MKCMFCSSFIKKFFSRKNKQNWSFSFISIIFKNLLYRIDLELNKVKQKKNEINYTKQNN